MDSSGFTSGTSAVKRSVSGLQGGILTLSRTIADQKAKLHELGRAGKGASTQYKELKADIARNRDILGSMNTELRNTIAVSGKAGGAFAGLGGSLSKFAAIAAGAFSFSALAQGFMVVADFEQALADLNAISGATADELKSLEETARGVAKASSFTATQVVNLQTELSKLGFGTSEINLMTQSVVNLSTALGADATEAATILGGQLKAFGADAGQAAKFAEILGATANKSAVGFEDFAMMLPKVSAAAAQVGWDFAQMNATLGVLRDRNIRAEAAGTALRNILLENAERGLDYKAALDSINTSTDKLSAASKLYGKENAIVAVTLAETQDIAAKATEEIRSMNGVLAEMNRIKLDTFKGQVTLLKSAFQELLLSISDSSGVMKTWVTGLADATSALAQLIKYGSIYGKEFDRIDAARRQDVARHISGNIEKIKSEKITLDEFNKSIEQQIAAKQYLISQDKKFTDQQKQNARNQIKYLEQMRDGVYAGLNTTSSTGDAEPKPPVGPIAPSTAKQTRPTVVITPVIDAARMTAVVAGIEKTFTDSDVMRIGYGAGIQYITGMETGIASKEIKLDIGPTRIAEELGIFAKLDSEFTAAENRFKVFGDEFEFLQSKLSATSQAINSALEIQQGDPAVMNELISGYDAIISKIKEMTAAQREAAYTQQLMSDTLLTVSSAASESFAAIATGSKKSGDAVKDFAREAVKAILKFVQAKLLAAAASQIEDGSSKYGWYGLIIAAGAIAGIYSMIDSAASKSKQVRLAKGGAAFSETAAIIGDNPNARFDPEVVAPLSKIENMISVKGGQHLTGTFVVKGPDLLLAINNAERYMGKVSR